MGPFVVAWIIGEGIVTYRWIRDGAPPPPGALLTASGFFVLLAILAQYQPARTAATLLAYGVDLAALLQILPGSAGAKDQTGNWPPAKITDGTIILPTGKSHNPVAGGNTGGGTSAGAPPGTTVPGVPQLPPLLIPGQPQL